MELAPEADEVLLAEGAELELELEVGLDEEEELAEEVAAAEEAAELALDRTAEGVGRPPDELWSWRRSRGEAEADEAATRARTKEGVSFMVVSTKRW